MPTLSKNQKKIRWYFNYRQTGYENMFKKYFLHKFTEDGHLRNSKYHLLAILSTHSLCIYIVYLLCIIKPNKGVIYAGKNHYK